MITVNPCNVLRALWNDYCNDFHLTNTVSESESNLIKLLKSIIDSSIHSGKCVPSAKHLVSSAQPPPPPPQLPNKVAHFKCKYTSSLSSSSSHLDLIYDSEGQVSPIDGKTFYFDNNCNYRNSDHTNDESASTRRVRKTRVSPVQHTSPREGHSNYLRSYSSPFNGTGGTGDNEQLTSCVRGKDGFNQFNRSLSTDAYTISFNVSGIPSPVLPTNVSACTPGRACRSLSMASLTINEELPFTHNERDKSHSLLQSRDSVCNEKSSAHVLAQRTEGNITREQCQLSAKKKKHKQRLLHFLLRRPSIETLEAKGIIKNELVFGCDLNALCEKEQTTIPKFVKIIIASIEVKNLKTDGIYRVSGNLSQVQKLRFQINQDNYNAVWKEEDIHILTSLFKMFLREMKQPLISSDLFDTLIASVNIDNYQRKIDTVVRLIDSLDLVHYHTLKYILQHLLRSVLGCWCARVREALGGTQCLTDLP